MKRSKGSSRAMRHKRNGITPDGKHNSKYGQKVASGDQMYGPGCCAHTLSVNKVNQYKEQARAGNNY